MAENEKTEMTEANKEELAILQEYKKLQETSVPKEIHEKEIAELKEKNAIYLKAITEGSQVDTSTDNSSVDLKDAITEISKFKGTNLEYWEKMTPTIDQVLKSMPESEITKITGSQGLEEIVKVNETMKQMVKDSNGDCDMFRALYKARVTDSAPKISAEIEKAGGLVNYFNEKQKQEELKNAK